MTQNDTSLRMSVFWAPREYAMQIFLLLFSSMINYLQNHIQYDISAVIASFLRKLQQILPIHTTKHAVTERTEYMRDLRLAKSFQIFH
jgi:hypothetical protein